jgi:FAD/FMN-containing dehydrogenase
MPMRRFHAPSLVNDMHSALNATWVEGIYRPSCIEDIRTVMAHAERHGLSLATCGGRHAMGGHQFAVDAALLDMGHMRRVLHFDAGAGLIEVEAGIQWPELIDYLESTWAVDNRRWSIRQKQTGADRLSLGGCLSANIHGRGLRMRPFIDDLEAFTLVDANGDVRHCSRTSNRELFSLAIGGYGLFGVIASVTLRLAPRRIMRRDVTLLQLEALMPAFAERIAAGYTFGDFQFAIDPRSGDFMNRGVFSCYIAVDDAPRLDGEARELSEQDWRDLLHLAHTDKTRAFECYARHYLSTDSQHYWSDRLQQSTYLDGYHLDIDSTLGHCGSEVIGEIYVPRERLVDFMHSAASDFRRHGVDLIYGTIRLIECDTESFLPWARQDYACVIFNLHTPHTAEGVDATHRAFRRLIDMAITDDGSFYLTYSRAASAAQVSACYPRFTQFLHAKRRYDPQQRFQNNWYRHYSALFASTAEGLVA